jgi:CRP-like cAMP-binding protein
MESAGWNAVGRVTQGQVMNRLLRLLPKEVFRHLAPHLEPIDLPVKRSLVRAREPIEHVCFIENGLASMVAESADGRGIEIRHIGFEGVAN